jgi:hypothetical protein
VYLAHIYNILRLVYIKYIKDITFNDVTDLRRNQSTGGNSTEDPPRIRKYAKAEHAFEPQPYYDEQQRNLK